MDWPKTELLQLGWNTLSNPIQQHNWVPSLTSRGDGSVQRLCSSLEHLCQMPSQDQQRSGSMREKNLQSSWRENIWSHLIVTLICECIHLIRKCVWWSFRSTESLRGMSPWLSKPQRIVLNVMEESTWATETWWSILWGQQWWKIFTTSPQFLAVQEWRFFSKGAGSTTWLQSFSSQFYCLVWHTWHSISKCQISR